MASLSTWAMAQEKFELGKPNNDAYRYLDEYQALKDYIDYSKYPNFKLGAGTTVNDYLNNSLFKNLINKNFTETVAGNAMKMASCVDGNGNMNFTTVKNYVNAATKAGLNVYGHTLAWHSQQPNGWLRKLLADKPAPDLVDGDVDVWSQIYSKDFRTNQNIAWKASETDYAYTLSFDATNGLNIHTTKSQQSWVVQFLAATDILTTTGNTYKMTMTVKGSKAGRLHSKLGDWGGGANADIPFTTEWQDVEVNYKATMASNFLLLQCGDHKVVITLGIAFTGGKIRHRNSLCLAVNGCYLVLHTNVDIKTVAHHFGSHKKQRVSAADHVAHMIGQSAVGIGDILAAFENDDLTLAVESAQTCGAARAACNAANDYGFSRHFLKPLFTVD